MNGELTGREAYEWGWANRAVPEEELGHTALAMARKIALYSPELMRLKKVSINKLAEAQGFPDAVRHGAYIDAIARASAVCQDAYAEIREIGLSTAVANMRRAVQEAERRDAPEGGLR
jgi:enoyl-CoA hydratase